MDANLEAIDNLRGNLSQHGYDLEKVPYVLQLNKRDLPTAVSAEEMGKALRLNNEPIFEAVATNGNGVFNTLKGVVKQVLMDLKSR